MLSYRFLVEFEWRFNLRFAIEKKNTIFTFFVGSSALIFGSNYYSLLIVVYFLFCSIFPAIFTVVVSRLIYISSNKLN